MVSCLANCVSTAAAWKVRATGATRIGAASALTALGATTVVAAATAAAATTTTTAAFANAFSSSSSSAAAAATAIAVGAS